MTVSSSSYRVLIVDDHPIVRDGLSGLFNHEPGFTVCGAAGDIDEAYDAVARLQPDLVLVDLALRGSSGLDLIRTLQQDFPDVAVLVLSMQEERLFAEQARQAGARGYVMKSRPDAEVFRAARLILTGQTSFSSYVERNKPEEPLFNRDEKNLLDQLTNREQEVFLLLGQGYKPRHIAEKLQLSISTIEVYRQHLKEKLKVKTAAELTRYAIFWYGKHEEPEERSK
jgi:DNA-binding NarL/FixJ family response regulator